MNQLTMTELQQAEKELFELTKKVAELRKNSKQVEVKNYNFQDTEGEVSLLKLFGDKEILFLIHNMGQGCRYCTLWADGFNGFIPHLENNFALVVASKDTPQVQRQFANSRGWRIKMVSHVGGDYIKEQTVQNEHSNAPGIVCYFKKEDQIFRKNSASFGPGDEFCAQWDILSLGGITAEEWTPQLNYWVRPEKMDDGGKNLNCN